MKNILRVIIALLLGCHLHAQSSLTGKILTSTNTPLEFANVFLLTTTDSSLVQGNITDIDGKYALNNVPTGDYLLSAAMIGYTQKYQLISVDKTMKIAPDLILTENAAELEEVLVTSKRPLFEQKIDRLIVNVKNSVTSAGNNALEVLKRAPGVRIDGINSEISLAGVNGVIVEINGKRNRMSGDALLQMLQAMPADNIEKIEIINVPPSSYDAEGIGGIINIVTAKSQEEGTNGSYTLNAGYGERPKYGASFNVNMRKGKWTVFTDLSADQNYLQEDVTINKAVQTEDALLITDTYSNRPASRTSYNGRAGINYNLTKNTVIGILASGYRTDWDLDARTETTITANGNLIERSNLRSVEKNDWNHMMYNFNFLHNFTDKGKVTFDYDYLEYFNTNPTNYTDDIKDSNGTFIKETAFISRKENPINFHVFKSDYSRPFSDKWNVETGLKVTMSDFSNDNYLAYIIDGQPVPDPLYTNLVNMNEDVYAAYISTDYQITKKTSAKAGLRYEYTNVVLGNPAETLTKRQYGRFFPSVFLSHNFDDNNSFQLSYNERISRPSLNILAPSFFFFSPNVIMSGNPLVRATFLKNARLSYRHKTVSFTLQASDSDNPMVWGNLEVIADENLTVSRPVNIEDEKGAVFFINVPWQITKWWKSNIETGFGYQQQDLIFNGQSIRQKNTYAGLFGNQSFTLKGDFNLEIDGYLYTGYRNGLASGPTQGGFNLGLRKKLKNGGSITLNCQDVGNLGSFWRQTYERSDLNLVFNQTYQLEGSVFRLTWSQPFGNNQLKQQQRGTASEEESGRVQ